MLREPKVMQQARERWGAGIFDESGQIVRKRVADIVFGRDEASRQELAYLEQITHPRIGEKLRDQAVAAAATGKKLLILDAPVMLKAGWDTMCRWVLLVDAPLSQRLERARQRGWSQEDFHFREAAQEPLDVKRRRSDFVVDNSGSPEATKRQVERLWTQLVG